MRTIIYRIALFLSGLRFEWSRGWRDGFQKREEPAQTPGGHPPWFHEPWRQRIADILRGPDDGYTSNYIQAIKALREETGLGLVEAKRAVDNLRSELGIPR